MPSASDSSLLTRLVISLKLLVPFLIRVARAVACYCVDRVPLLKQLLLDLRKLVVLTKFTLLLFISIVFYLTKFPLALFC